MEEKLIDFFKSMDKISFDFAGEISLDDPSICYFIEDGDAEIYFLDKKNNKKYFVFGFIKNNCIFSVKPNDDFKLIAQIENKTIVRKIQLEKIFQNDLFLQDMTSFFNNWIFSLCDKLFFEKNKKIELYLEDNITYEKVKNKLFAIMIPPKEKKQVFWCYLKEGKFSLKDQTNIFFESLSIFPVVSKFYAKSFNENIVIEKTDLFSFFKKNRSIEEFNKISEKLLFQCFFDFKRNLLEENKRILLRARLERRLLKKTVSLLLSLLWKKKKYLVISNHPFIIQAFEIVAKNMEIEVKLPRFLSDIKNYINTINEIADSSSIRVKKIVLDRKWWKKDVGHFIGFKKDSNKPVAVIKKFNGYIYFDPESGETKKKLKDIYSDLSSEGYSLYKSFTIEKPTNKQIFSFAISGKKKELFFQFFLGLLIIGFNFSIPLASGILFKRIIPFLDQSLLTQLFIGLIIISVSLGIFLIISGILALHIQTWMQFILQTALWDKLLKLPVSFFSRYTIGNLIRKSFSVTFIQNVINNTLFTYVFTAFFSIFYLIVMFVYSAKLAWIGLAVVIFGCSVLFFMYKKIILRSIEKIEKTSDYNGFLIQVIKGIEKIRMTALEKIIYSKWGQKYFDYNIKSLAANKINVFATAWSNSLSIFSMICIFFVGLKSIEKNLLVSDFIAFYIAFGMFSFSIFKGVQALANSLGVVIPFWKQARIIINEKELSKKELIEPNKLMGYIEVDKLSFKYEDSDNFVLQNISLKIDPGEFVAIVGPSGCGKSTLYRLLFKFYEPHSGSIYYDGNDLSNLDAVKLRKQMGIVLQDSDLLAGTIYDNLLIQEGITEDVIDEAMKLAGFDKVIKELPMKYFTYLSEGGKNLSGGQKQQLLIARSLLRKPQIFFLDEATNALDNKTQEQITENIKNLKMTRVVIAHRLSTIRSADRIYVMDQGKIIEQGSWDELIAKNGLFANLVKKQKM